MSDPHLTASNAADPHTTVHAPHHGHHVHETRPLHDPVDTWHDHSHDERPQHAHGEVQNSNIVLAVGLALTAVIVASVIVVYGFYVHYNTQRADDRERTTAGAPLLETRGEKVKDLSMVANGGSFQMATEDEKVKKTVTIAPVGQAMDKVVQTYVKTPAAK
jgi:hypothetical protein